MDELQDTLPKTDFLTTIDKLIVLTVFISAFNGAAMVALYRIHEQAGADVAKIWNFNVEVGVAVFYVLANLAIFLPPLTRRLIRTQKMLCCQTCFAAKSPKELHKPSNGYADTFRGYADRVSLIGAGELDDDDAEEDRKAMKENVKKNPKAQYQQNPVLEEEYDTGDCNLD